MFSSVLKIRSYLKRKEISNVQKTLEAIERIYDMNVLENCPRMLFDDYFETRWKNSTQISVKHFDNGKMVTILCVPFLNVNCNE